MVSHLNSTVEKIVGSGLKRTKVPCLLVFPRVFERMSELATMLETDVINLPFAEDRDVNPLGKRIGYGRADTMKTGDVE
jgi:hypothetical protein